jgi:hypothetical protein
MKCTGVAIFLYCLLLLRLPNGALRRWFSRMVSARKAVRTNPNLQPSRPQHNVESYRSTSEQPVKALVNQIEGETSAQVG